MDHQTLKQENVEYAGTLGVSASNRCAGFLPAFRDEATGRVELARDAHGNPAPMHLICGLPQEWALDRDAQGQICRLKLSIVAGFVRNDVFYTRDEANAMLTEERGR